jgi:hypothetical protein
MAVMRLMGKECIAKLNKRERKGQVVMYQGGVGNCALGAPVAWLKAVGWAITSLAVSL